MTKKILPVVLLVAIFAIILCTSKQNPYTIPGNARISLLLRDSRDVPGVDLAVSDTVGHTIKVGVCPFLPDFIDSALVSMLKFNSGSDSVIVIKRFSSDADTQWFDFTFSSAKKCSVSVKAFIRGGTEYSVNGIITIFGKPVSGSISPAADTLPVDSLVLLAVQPAGDGPYAYQWYHDTTLLSGKTGFSLAINHLTLADSGKYSCLITDKWGDTGTSNSIRLVVVPKQVVRINTKPKLVIDGHRNILSTEICTLSVSVTDPDSGQTDLITLVKGPAGNTFSSNKMIWKPTAGFLGADTAVFAVVDNGVPPLTDTQKVAVVVSATILPPDSVKGMVAVSRVAGNFVFRWNKVANADAYIVFRSKDTTGFVQYLTVSDTTFTNSIKDTAFYYYVVATNSQGQSFPSSIVHSTAINAPPKWSHDSISVTVNQGTLVSINCADSCKDTNGDAVTFSLAAGGSATDSIVGTTWKYTPTSTDSGLFTAKIKAFDGMDSSVVVLSVHVMTVLHAPSGLTYSSNPASYWTTVAITPNTPTVIGTVDSFSVSPALPAGLTLNKITGAISGTPTTVTALAAYIVTAKNQAGSTTVSVSITVNGPSSGFTYSSNPATFWVGVAIAPDSAKVTGTVDSFSVSPALPSGLTLNKLTGVITGTPTAASVATAYTITAKNQGGTTTASLSIAVNGKPSAFTYSANPATFWTNVAIIPDSAKVTGTVDSFTVSPTLPATLTLDKSTGIITGTPTSALVPTSYTVTAKNQAGATTASLSISVNGPPTAFTYSANPATFWVGVAIAPDSAKVTGTVDSFTVSPALPSPLTLNKSTGTITGTPTSVLVPTSYTVTAKNQAGTATASLSITVNGAPSAFTFSANPATFWTSVAITPDSARVTGVVDSFTVSPTLPAGLTLNKSTGVITGTPTSVLVPTSYTVTAKNQAGSATANLSITVNGLPTAFTYSANPATFWVGAAVTPDSAKVTGVVDSFTVSSLPAGLTINKNSGTISGTPTAVVAAMPCTVTVRNTAGSAKAVLAITVGTLPKITTQPVSASAWATDSAVFTVTASGTAPLHYQWRKNGTTVAGATSASFTYKTIAYPGDSGAAFTCVVSNDFSRSDTSSAASLKIKAVRAVSASDGWTRYSKAGHSLILLTDGSLWACGSNSSGQLGNGLTSDTSLPIHIADSVQSITAGFGYSMILKSNAQLFACGSIVSSSTPVYLMSGVKGMAAGAGHYLILSNNGDLWASGDNTYGQFGNGTTASSSVPLKINSGIKSIAANGYYSLILKGDTVWGSGNNGLGGMLWNGATGIDSFFAIAATGVQSIAAGYSHSLIVRNDSVLACGDNSAGELGDGTNSNDSNFVQVLSSPGHAMNGIKSIAAGWETSFILKTDGSLWAFGINGFGELGDGTTTPQPFSVQTMTNVQTMSTGDWHTLVVKKDGTLWGCGNSRVGQLGIGTKNDQNTPPVQIKF